MGQGSFLGLLQIGEQSSRRDHAAVIAVYAKGFHTAHLEMLPQSPLTALVVKIPGIQGVDGDPQSVFQIVKVHPAHIKSLIADQL